MGERATDRALATQSPEVAIAAAKAALEGFELIRKTVEHHVGNVLAKLGLRNRAEAAAYATRENPSRAVDRATFPSDTISTHLVHPPGVAALRRWGLLDRLTATGCPPIGTYLFDFGPFTISGAPGTDNAPVA